MTRPSVTEEETLESLGPYFFIQRKAGHRLTSDSIALSEFAAQSLAENDNVIDLTGSATGAIAVLLAWKTKARSITGVEVDEAAFQTALRNVEANGLDERVSSSTQITAPFRLYFQRALFRRW